MHAARVRTRQHAGTTHTTQWTHEKLEGTTLITVHTVTKLFPPSSVFTLGDPSLKIINLAPLLLTLTGSASIRSILIWSPVGTGACAIFLWLGNIYPLWET